MAIPFSHTLKTSPLYATCHSLHLARSFISSSKQLLNFTNLWTIFFLYIEQLVIKNVIFRTKILFSSVLCKLQFQRGALVLIKQGRKQIKMAAPNRMQQNLKFDKICRACLLVKKDMRPLFEQLTATMLMGISKVEVRWRIIEIFWTLALSLSHSCIRACDASTENVASHHFI